MIKVKEQNIIINDIMKEIILENGDVIYISEEDYKKRLENAEKNKIIWNGVYKKYSSVIENKKLKGFKLALI